jgi:hypothetical protein
MAKYTSTSIEFFLKLSWREGLAYFIEVAQLLQEEKDQMESSSSVRSMPQLPNTSGWPK